MRSPTILFIGLMSVLGMLSLNVQKQSLAGSESPASHMGIESASLLSMGVAHDHSHNDIDLAEHAAFENVAKRKIERMRRQPLRRVVTKAAAAPTSKVAVAPKPRMVAAIAAADIQTKHKEIANEVLLALPSKCRDTLKNFYVKYEKQKHRGLAGKSVLILDGTVPDEEFRALFVHESGHNWDLGCLQGTKDAGKSNFSDGDAAIYKNDPSLGFYNISWITSSVQRSNSNPEDFVSGYASYDIFEDFAESFAYFVLQNAVFAERAQDNAAIAAKYIWFRDTLFNGQVPHIASGKSVYKGKAPWDTTKLKYAWHPIQTVVQK
ncbi:MAG: hypothetical protein HOG89_02380 [Candidatus Peribacter sp.]|jgi:hypothetical protein|nr:hypothetical protein [Candidatus Peribacter sp.]MBT4393319.1 hypothetical protein [Candidatus Peribacter sp.]MBT4600945.1 hypothetical protein [Candidatus Peribacter sp.]MBT5148826.1 hypothetical protein [Candidatus Peribacter sp.]MBT5637910.1 hypothetical protein [Candidatus Peribacter sp.]